MADENAEGGFRQVAFQTYLQHVNGTLPAADPRPQVAVVVAEGAIAGGDLPPGQVGGESTSALLREARDDDNVKAVVLRVNSPGGAKLPHSRSPASRWWCRWATWPRPVVTGSA